MMTKRYFSVLLFCCLLGLSACSLIFGESESEEDGMEGGIERYPDLIMRGFIRSAVDQKGTLLWQIKAREGRVFNDSNHIYLTDFIFYSFDENDGSLRSTLRARRGFMDNNTETLTAKLDVVLRSENGRVLETEEAEANNREKIISNTILNRITQEDGTVMIGTHLWAHSDLGVFRLQATQGEAPEGAEDAMFGSGEKKSDSDSRPTGGGNTQTGPSTPGGTGGRDPSGSGSASGSFDHLLPDFDEESLERIRDEIAFPRTGSTVPQPEEPASTHIPDSPQETPAPVEGILTNEEPYTEEEEG